MGDHLHAIHDLAQAKMRSTSSDTPYSLDPAKMQSTSSDTPYSLDPAHKLLHDAVMGGGVDQQSKELMEKLKEAMAQNMAQKSADQTGDLVNLKKELEALKAKLAKQESVDDENQMLKTKLQTLQNVQDAKNKDMGSAKQKLEGEKNQLKTMQKEKEKADKKNEALQKARDALVADLKKELAELRAKAEYRKKMRLKKEVSDKKELEEEEKRKNDEQKAMEEEEEKDSKAKVTEAKAKATEAKAKRIKSALDMKKFVPKSKEDQKASQLARQRLEDKRLRDRYRDKGTDFHLNRLQTQLPFIGHFIGPTGSLHSTCGEARCRCCFYKLKWTYKDHCYLVEGECQACDAPDEKKIKAIGFTYKYFEEVHKRLPVFTYRRRGKNWHNEPKEKSVCPEGKIVTGVRTTVAKAEDNHKHNMKIKCGPGKGTDVTEEKEEE